MKLTCIECGYERHQHHEGRAFCENADGDLVCFECIPVIAEGALPPGVQDYLQGRSSAPRRGRPLRHDSSE